MQDKYCGDCYDIHCVQTPTKRAPPTPRTLWTAATRLENHSTAWDGKSSSRRKGNEEESEGQAKKGATCVASKTFTGNNTKSWLRTFSCCWAFGLDGWRWTAWFCWCTYSEFRWGNLWMEWFARGKWSRRLTNFHQVDVVCHAAAGSCAWGVINNQLAVIVLQFWAANSTSVWCGSCLSFVQMVEVSAHIPYCSIVRRHAFRRRQAFLRLPLI